MHITPEFTSAAMARWLHIPNEAKEAYAFLGSLFLGGLKDLALITELCPEGRENAPLFACYHPTPRMRYQKSLKWSRNFKRLGLCLWDIFSNNHEVIAADGRIIDLGSFSGSAGVISDFYESLPARDDADLRDADGSGYMDFYMGTYCFGKRAEREHLHFTELL